jgi:hypothetical protein
MARRLARGRGGRAPARRRLTAACYKTDVYDVVLWVINMAVIVIFVSALIGEIF